MKGKNQRVHIGIFGRRNYGKSTTINAIVGQEIAIVSDVPGTTTDPVKKTMEISGIGPVVFIDTAGIDDIGTLGKSRIDKTFEILDQIDIAILLISNNLFDEKESNLISNFEQRKIPYIIIYNKSDVYPPSQKFISDLEEKINKNIIVWSALEDNTDTIIENLKEKVQEVEKNFSNDMMSDLIDNNDLVILVTPIDEAAPEGRLILPQVQAIRNVLDHNAFSIVCKVEQLENVLKSINTKPSIVVTVRLTGFSILLARLKGNFEKYKEGNPKLKDLKDGDKILILESCTHKTTCNDIGSVVLPNAIKKFTGKDLIFDKISGFTPLPNNLKDYSLIIQCGGCMFTKKQLESRLRLAIEQNIPITNYGMVFAYINGLWKAVNI
jgi:[FeFe] hydrogenase H-cluster maturation GTPase HydF